MKRRRQHQTPLRTRHGDVEQPHLFGALPFGQFGFDKNSSEVGGLAEPKAHGAGQPVVRRPHPRFSMIDLPVQARYDHHGEFQPLGLVDAQQPDCSTRALGREPFFDNGAFSLFGRIIHPFTHPANDFPKRGP